MSSRLVPVLLAAAGVVFACGTLPRPELRLRRPAAPEVEIAHATAAPKPRKALPADSAVIDASLVVRQSSDGVRFALAIANGSKHRLEVSFPDGQTREFLVLDAAGREVWRWSAGRLFTQAMQSKLLTVGDTVTFAERWRDAAPGTYTVVATLRSDNFPVTRRAAFVVAPAGAGPAEPAAPSGLTATR